MQARPARRPDPEQNPVRTSVTARGVTREMSSTLLRRQAWATPAVLDAKHGPGSVAPTPHKAASAAGASQPPPSEQTSASGVSQCLLKGIARRARWDSPKGIYARALSAQIPPRQGAVDEVVGAIVMAVGPKQFAKGFVAFVQTLARNGRLAPEALDMLMLASLKAMHASSGNVASTLDAYLGAVDKQNKRAPEVDQASVNTAAAWLLGSQKRTRGELQTALGKTNGLYGVTAKPPAQRAPQAPGSIALAVPLLPKAASDLVEQAKHRPSDGARTAAYTALTKMARSDVSPAKKVDFRFLEKMADRTFEENGRRILEIDIPQGKVKSCSSNAISYTLRGLAAQWDMDATTVATEFLSHAIQSYGGERDFGRFATVSLGAARLIADDDDRTTGQIVDDAARTTKDLFRKSGPSRALSTDVRDLLGTTLMLNVGIAIAEYGNPRREQGRGCTFRDSVCNLAVVEKNGGASLPWVGDALRSVL